MFSDWISLRSSVEDGFGVQSVLQSYPPNVGKDVATNIVHSLHYSDKARALVTKEQLDWTMEVICYGLTMPMTEIDLIRNCAYIYLDWTTAIANGGKSNIPKPIINEKELYFRKILSHLTNLFIPRESSSSPEQAKLCSQVLYHVKSLVNTDKPLKKEIWEDLLVFFVGTAGHLLSPPPFPKGLAEHLCDQLINSLFFVWLLAVRTKFPAPPLWATLQDFCLSWRHHQTLISHWNKLMCSLTLKVLHVLYGPHCLPEDTLKDEYRFTVPEDLAPELTVQCWFRFLHILGSPVALSVPKKITCTQYFMQYALEQGTSPDEHSSIRSLPESFLRAMKGVSMLVDMFLDVRYIKQGTPLESGDHHFNEAEGEGAEGGSLSPSPSLDMLSSILTIPGPMSPTESEGKSFSDLGKAKTRMKSSAAGPGVNSILHIFGAWLFDATLSGVDLNRVLASFGSIGKDLISTVTSASQGLVPKKDDFQHGRAEAFSILCHIFSSQKADESILPVYLGRFYLSMAIGLCYKMAWAEDETTKKSSDIETLAGHVLSSILMSAEDILRIDLQGVQVLIPHIIQALEISLPVSEKELNLGNHYPNVLLKRSSIQLLLSMLCLPLQFLTLTIQPIWEGSSAQETASDSLTFLALKPRLTRLLTQALDVETDPVNIQMLLGGAMLLIQDTVAVEKKNTLTPSTGSGPSIIIEAHDEDSLHRSATMSTIPKLSNGNNDWIHRSADDDHHKDKDAQTKPRVGSVGDSKDLATTKGLFFHMAPLLCQKLMFSTEWRLDMNVTLSALELLSGLAQLDAKFIDMDEAKKCMKWICNYIEFQANKPAPFHVRDLHSIIVAAFNCLSQWILNHHWLLNDDSCLIAVLEVVELGISGTKSKGYSSGSGIVMKGDKELKPASFRVREAAEGVLAYIMEQTGSFPNPSGPSSLSTLLDEKSLLNNAVRGDRRKFLYYAMDGSCIVGILEDTVDKSLDHLPSVTSIIRGPTGKTASLKQLRFFSRSKQDIAYAYLNEPPRPDPNEMDPQVAPANQRCYPETVSAVDKVHAEYSIPNLDDILEENLNEAQSQMKTLMKVQTELEEIAIDVSSEKDIIAGEEKQPNPQNDFRAARLYLSHMGMLNLSGIERRSNRQFPRLLRLSSTDEAFENSLNMLDRMSNRTYDTLYIVLVRKGQTEGDDILKNEITPDDEHFVECVMSIGWPVTVGTHSGWTGNAATSWLVKEQLSSLEDQEACGDQILYFSDVTTELAVIVPAINIRKAESPEFFTPRTGEDEQDSPSPTRTSFKRSESEETSEQPEQSTKLRRQMSDPSETKVLRKQATTQETSSTFSEVKARGHSSSSETKVIVAWLQDFNDHAHFPIFELIGSLDSQDAWQNQVSNASSRAPEKEICVIFVHPLKTGLFRIKLKTVFGSSVGGPLIDGMVVSRRVLGNMIRNTTINFCRRRRLEIDNYSPPHACRKIKIQEMIKKFSQDSNVPDFFASTFQQDLLST